MKLTRRWVIPERIALEYPSQSEAYRFLRAIGVDVNSPHTILDEKSTMTLIVCQEQERQLPPDQPSEIEADMLEELVDDNELWFYTPEMERCKTGDIWRVAELPIITSYVPRSPMDTVKMECKNLRVQKYGATVNYERVEILAAVDPDTLEVYWCRVQPR
jgi:hypothetical protein